MFVTSKFCRDKHTFVATKDVFCHEKHVFVMTKHIFVAAEMILVAAPANDVWVALSGAHLHRHGNQPKATEKQP